MNKYEKGFKICWTLCQASGKAINVFLIAAFAAYGLSMASGAGCDHYKKKIREYNNSNRFKK